MNSAADRLAAFPPTLERGAGTLARTYLRSATCFAALASPGLAAITTLETDAGVRLSVYRIDASSASAMQQAGDAILAVYEDPASGAMALPTGRVFVRFAPSIHAETMRATIEHAGYRIVNLPAYAPNAAWVESDDGSVAGALMHLPRLRSLPDTEHVEPQLLSARAAK